jgi:hypothetical protein
LKYSSIHTAIAIIRIKFRKLATPRYAKNKKKVTPKAVIRPRLLVANIKEKVKSRLKNEKTKNAGTAKKVDGSIKYVNPASIVQSTTVTTKVGKKFRLLTIPCWRCV